MEIKIILLNARVFAILLYASETWTTNKDDQERLLAFEVYCYRQTLAIRQQDYGTDKEIRRAIQQNEMIIDTVCNRKLQLFGQQMTDCWGRRQWELTTFWCVVVKTSKKQWWWLKTETTGEDSWVAPAVLVHDGNKEEEEVLGCRRITTKHYDVWRLQC